MVNHSVSGVSYYRSRPFLRASEWSPVPNRPQAEKKSSQEHQLFEFTQRLAKFRAGRRAIHIHLSQLRADNRRGHHIRIAINTFEFLVKQMDGQVFALGNADLIFVCKGADIAAIDQAVMRLRHLFNDDPLTQDIDERQESRFCSWYDLERQYDEFLAIAHGLNDEDQKRSRRLAAITGPGQPGQPAELPPLSPHRLGELVDALSRADLSNMMRRQVICAITPDAP